MDAPKRIFAWSVFPTSHLVGTWSVTRYPNNAEHYILAAEHDRIVAEKDAEIARLRHQIHEVSEPDFLFGAMDNVHDMDVTLADFADAASRAIRAALENRDANI